MSTADPYAEPPKPTRQDVIHACEVLLRAGYGPEALAVLGRVLGVGWTTSLVEGARLAAAHHPRFVD